MSENKNGRNEDTLKTLPIGTYDFGKLRQRGHIYVDKTRRLVELITSGDWYFLSRPRRFGKSLTISTLEAMFRGQKELFKGLAAEAWVAEQAEHPAPVLHLDMSMLDTIGVPQMEQTLSETLDRISGFQNIELRSQSVSGKFQDIIAGLFRTGGPVVVLVDEYDKPILDSMEDLERADAIRASLRTFYTVLKGCDKYLRFVMLTGISKFTKTGVFSAMNNLQDISVYRQYGDIVGYTQAELEENFSGWIDKTAAGMNLDRRELLKRVKDYYDGFCFDGETRLYNPFSILNFLAGQEFKNYWYSSGSPSFIASYMKRHRIQDPEEYRHREVPPDFAEVQEIERATPESFLYQSGYLTIEEKRENSLVLDYPNYEVRSSLVRMYLDQVYHVREYITLGGKLWKALNEGDLEETVRLYNIALAGIPYSDFPHRDEGWYRSLFLMLLRGAGIPAAGEVPTSLGRSDALIQFPRRVVVLEFKYAKNGTGIKGLRQKGQSQIEEKGYARPFDADGREITAAVVIVDGKKRQAVL